MINSPDEYAHSDWSESDDKNISAQNALKNYIATYGKDMYEILMQIWYDWYRDYSKEFVENISSFGYEYTIHKQENDNSLFVIVYEPSIIEIVEVMNKKDLIKYME